MASEEIERRLVAILMADVAGYSRLIGMDDEGTLAQLNAHHVELIEPKIKEHRGRIVRTTGDGLLVLFVSAVDALRCAVEIQHTMTQRNAHIPADSQINFRMGINVDLARVVRRAANQRGAKGRKAIGDAPIPRAAILEPSATRHR